MNNATTLPQANEMYAELPNGREIREVQLEDGKAVYMVQPRNDNYWLACRTPEGALQAFRNPSRFLAASARLRAKYPELPA